jgi:hypothetical protein
MLRVMDVRVEGVQDTTEEDARAEGVPPNWCGDIKGWDPEEHGYLGTINDETEDEGYFRTAREAFRELWDSINAKRGCGWDTNPWVWVIGFERVKGQA